ncbi:MAG: M23 family metallopeptidase [Candidatus Levybacteria bacterium]|nr:M23 family metallopeptidase [Candidatus Levybacteria bacterium]MBP9815219.1 M23 family metallopeptidase [Candidatus Levybacteria bacterium]
MKKAFSFLSFKQLKKTTKFLASELRAFFIFFKIYIQDKLISASSAFETRKNAMVKGVLIKRGKKNRFFLHLSIMVILTVGVLISPFISETQLFGKNKDLLSFAQENGPDSLSLTQDNVFQTQNTVGIRDKVIKYSVQKGDTISTIAKKYGITEDTIKWQNDLSSDDISIGQELEILPVTGIAHKVASGDTVYTIAKKYGVDAQAVVDFPFNDFANPQTFSLVSGQIVIVPEGVKPEEQAQPQYVRQTFIASGPVSVTASGFTWPIHGSLNQSFSWYHPGVDLGAAVGTPIIAAQNGTVSQSYSGGWNFGYGTHIVISGDNGYTTLYAHMSSLNVSAGDRVVAGKTVVGWVGLTGRTTGAHLHFEIRSNGGNLNPLGFLQ